MASLGTKLLTAATAAAALSQILKLNSQKANLPGAGGAAGSSALQVSQGKLTPADTMPAAQFEYSNPAQAAMKGTGQVSLMQYPSTLQNYYMQYRFFEYTRSAATDKGTQKNTSVIKLPLATNLMDSHNMSYADKQLGILGLLEGSGLLESLNTEMQGGNASEDSIRQQASDLAQRAVSGQGLQYALRTLVGSVSDTGGSAFERVTGTILNPFQALQFQGINLRDHSFTYRFSPNTPQESRALREIIKEFKIRMHPELLSSTLLFSFPDVCEITFGSAVDNLYYIKLCHLKSMSVNYAPQGTPAFFVGTREPVEIEMQLSFGEIEPMVREDIEKNYATARGNIKFDFTQGSETTTNMNDVTAPERKTVG